MPAASKWKTADGRLSTSRLIRTKRGRVRFIEGQRDGFKRLKAAGMRGPYVCHTIEQALAVLEAEGVPMLNWRIAA